MIRLAVILFASVLTFILIDNDPLIDTVFIAVGVWAIYENRQFVNIYSLIYIIVFMRAVEIALIYWLGGSRPIVFYPTYLFVDITTVLLIMFRVSILTAVQVHRYGEFDQDRFKPTACDYSVALVYVLYLMITMMSLVEHWIRHIDDIPFFYNFIASMFQYEVVRQHYAQYGIASAKQLVEHLYLNARHVYDSAPSIKAYLNILEHGLILSTSYKFMRSSSFIRA